MTLKLVKLEAETEGPRSYSSPAWALKWDPVSKILKKITGCFFNKDRSLFSCWSNDLTERKKMLLCQIEEGWKRGRVVGVTFLFS